MQVIKEKKRLLKKNQKILKFSFIFTFTKAFLKNEGVVW